MQDKGFYELLDVGRFRASEHTVGPWSSQAQHLGPVSALLVRELERCQPRPDTAIRRVTIDVLGPVPVDELAVRAEVIRPGRSVELLSAELSAGGRVAATARAWRMVRGDSSAVEGGHSAPLSDPDQWPTMPIPDGWTGGFANALEWRIADPAMVASGHAQTWARQSIPLVAGEETTALQRLFAVTDCASGISSPLSFNEWSFANTDLTVHLHREPAGEWIGLDARMTIGADAAGIASSVVHDTSGPVGRSAQSLLITPR